MIKTGLYKTCQTCGKEFYIPCWKIKAKKNKKFFYCSKDCWLNRPSVFHVCKTCGKKFRRTECQLKLNKSGVSYCSRKCRYLDPDSYNFRRTGKFTRCKVCGKQIHWIPSRNRKYCSTKCRSLDPGYRSLLSKTRILTGKIVECAFCKKKIYQHGYGLKRNVLHYCSVKCRGLASRGKPSKKRNGKIVKCSNCGKQIYRAKWRLELYNEFFCSLKCMREQLKYRVLNIIKPTKIEKKFMKLVKKYNLPYRYIGDGNFWIGRLNPDFIHTNGKKIVIEIFGDFWHNPSLNKYCDFNHTEKGRRILFKKYGFECMVIWEREFSKKNWENVVLNKLGLKNAQICNS